MSTTNILLTTFQGVSKTSTLCLPLPSQTTTEELLLEISSRLTPGLQCSRLTLAMTSSNRQIVPSHIQTLSCLTKLPPTYDLFSQNASSFLPLRLSVPLCGGKGGFGSQLRAAGGRMSSRKRRQNAEAATGSARNLDGRRLRTIAEAKSLATYLATKPEMEMREKEERRKRWEQVIEAAERREEEIRSGKGAGGRGKALSEEWTAEKEEIGEGVRDAVKKAMAMSVAVTGGREANRPSEKGEGTSESGSGGTGNGSEDESDGDGEVEKMELDEEDMQRLKDEADAGDTDAIWVLKNQVVPKSKNAPQRRYTGFDDDDDFTGSDEDDPHLVKGKAPA